MAIRFHYIEPDILCEVIGSNRADESKSPKKFNAIRLDVFPDAVKAVVGDSFTE